MDFCIIPISIAECKDSEIPHVKLQGWIGSQNRGGQVPCAKQGGNKFRSNLAVISEQYEAGQCERTEERKKVREKACYIRTPRKERTVLDTNEVHVHVISVLLVVVIIIDICGEYSFMCVGFFFLFFFSFLLACSFIAEGQV